MKMALQFLESVSLTIFLLAPAVPALAGGAEKAPVVVQPGKPGLPTKVLASSKMLELPQVPYPADVVFMQGMIHHHSQAVEMVDLLRTRGEMQAVKDLGERITISQTDEIEFMKKWLRDRNQPLTMDHGHGAHSAGPMLMPGMLTPAQMQELANATGPEFDRLFLTGMIQHHEGALVMVEELFADPGAGQDQLLFELATDIDNSQRAEIHIMCGAVGSAFFFSPAQCALEIPTPIRGRQEKPINANKPAVYSNPRSGPNDPRIGLKAGLYDAGTAIFGMKHVATIAKPIGFAPFKVQTLGERGEAKPLVVTSAKVEQADTRMVNPSTNSDLAFSGNHLFVGNYSGINIYDIEQPNNTKLLTSIICPGSQGDVSVYKNLLFMSAESMSGRIDCGIQGNPVPPGYKAPPPDKADEDQGPGGGVKATTLMQAIGAKRRREGSPPSPDRFRGVRIFDISDPTLPKQIAAVQSCFGSHTHTLVLDPKDKENVYIYISGAAKVRQPEELAGCSSGDPAKNPDTAQYRIDVIKVPLAHPEQAAIVNSPRVFADAEGKKLNALWKGGPHGKGTQTTFPTRGCHDITAYSAIGLAAGACSGNGILLDISDPAKPKRIEDVSDPNYAYWHSATFSNDGKKVLFTDEWGGGGQPRCKESDPMHWGADAIFTLNKGKLKLDSYYKMPASQTKLENCVAHNGSLIPIPGRDVFVQSWYQGGISIMDFTDSKHPFEIAYFDRGPGIGGFWSSYWYNGHIYGSEMSRGVDVFELSPNEHLTQNEIDAANQVKVDVLNVQNQQKITWPPNLIVARAYVDQLARSKALSTDTIASLNSAMAKGEQLQALAATLEKEAAASKMPVDKVRMQKLAEIFKIVASGK